MFSLPNLSFNRRGDKDSGQRKKNEDDDDDGKRFIKKNDDFDGKQFILFRKQLFSALGTYR